MAREFIGTSKNGVPVYVETEHSHAATHLKDTPHLLALVKEIVPTVEIGGDHLRRDFDMGRNIGKSDLVSTSDKDEIIYAKRPNREIYTRFVKNKTPEPTTFLAASFQRVNDAEYELFSAYLGRLAPTFPGDEFEMPESKDFWSKHALAWGTQEIVKGTETKICPW